MAETAYQGTQSYPSFQRGHRSTTSRVKCKMLVDFRGRVNDQLSAAMYNQTLDETIQKLGNTTEMQGGGGGGGGGGGCGTRSVCTWYN